MQKTESVGSGDPDYTAPPRGKGNVVDDFQDISRVSPVNQSHQVDATGHVYIVGSGEPHAKQPCISVLGNVGPPTAPFQQQQQMREQQWWQQQQMAQMQQMQQMQNMQQASPVFPVFPIHMPGIIPMQNAVAYGPQASNDQRTSIGQQFPIQINRPRVPMPYTR